MNSTSMDSPAYGGQVAPYDALLVQPDGRASVFASHGPGPRHQTRSSPNPVEIVK